LVFQFKLVRQQGNVTSNNNANVVNTPTGAANDEESDVMTTLEKLEAEAKDVSVAWQTSYHINHHHHVIVVVVMFKIASFDS